MRSGVMIAATLALTSCNQGKVDEKNATTAEVARAVAKENRAVNFTPGRWESTVRVASMEVPNMPAEARTAMNKAVGQGHSYASCLSKEAAAKPGADFFAKEAKDCTYDHFTMGGGKIDAAMRCSRGGASRNEVVMAMSGTYDPTHYDMAMETRIEAGAAGPMTMKMNVASTHVGACRGDEDGNS